MSVAAYCRRVRVPQSSFFAWRRRLRFADSRGRGGATFAQVRVIPTDNHADAFVVLPEPSAAGRIGRAAISGTTVARINVLDAAHTHARAKAGDAAKLESAAAGAARILWVESGTGTRYGVVRFGGAAGGGVKCVVITAFGNNLGTNTTYVCRDIDAAGAATGDPLTVYAMTSPAHAADLTECYPNHDLGDFIRVREETNFLAGSLRTEWFCIDTLVQRECAGP